MILASELKYGVVLLLSNTLYRIVTVDYHSGAGQMKGVVHVKMKNLVTSSVTEKRFRVEEKLEQVYLDKLHMQFLYADTVSFNFMNTETYEQIPVNKSIAPHLEPFLTPDTEVQVEFYEGQPVSILFPDTVELKVASTTAASLDSEGNVFKPAVLENNIEILVPQFISPGDIVKIDVAAKKYMERMKKSK